MLESKAHEEFEISGEKRVCCFHAFALVFSAFLEASVQIGFFPSVFFFFPPAGLFWKISIRTRTEKIEKNSSVTQRRQRDVPFACTAVLWPLHQPLKFILHEFGFSKRLLVRFECYGILSASFGNVRFCLPTTFIWMASSFSVFL